VLFSLVGCAVIPKPMDFYDGDRKGPQELAAIRIATFHIWVDEIDGKEINAFNNHRANVSEVRVLPGVHEITVQYFDLNCQSIAGTCSRKADGKVKVEAIAGHTYSVRFNFRDTESVFFYVVDHGVGYSERCPDLVPNALINIQSNKNRIGC